MKALLWVGQLTMALVLWLTGTETIFAAFVAITRDAIDPTNDNLASIDNTLGYEFKVGSRDILVTGLGTWDGDATDGLQASHDVGIWTTTGTLKASATVPAGTGTTKVGEYRYINLGTAVLLSANTNYRIGVYVLGDFNHGSLFDTDAPTNDLMDADWPIYQTPDVTFVQRVAKFGTTGLEFPNGGFQANTSGWDTPNFQFVPEPGGFALWLLGMVFADAVRRRRR